MNSNNMTRKRKEQTGKKKEEGLLLTGSLRCRPALSVAAAWREVEVERGDADGEISAPCCEEGTSVLIGAMGREEERLGGVRSIKRDD